MTIETLRFGAIEVDDTAVITFEHGLVGFPSQRRYAILDQEPLRPFSWLQCVDDPALAFLVVDPAVFFPDYDVEISGADAAWLGMSSENDGRMLVTVSANPPPLGITANLLGPLVICVSTGRAGQIILDSDKYSVREPIHAADTSSGKKK